MHSKGSQQSFTYFCIYRLCYLNITENDYLTKVIEELQRFKISIKYDKKIRNVHGIVANAWYIFSVQLKNMLFNNLFKI